MRHRRRQKAPRDEDARRQPLEVPLPGAGQRLVEIVDREHEVAFGRCEHAEIGEMRIAARLHGQSGDRRIREVGRHHGRRAAQEGERAREHPRVANGDQERQAASWPVPRGSPPGRRASAPARYCGMRSVRHFLAERLARGHALVDRRTARAEIGQPTRVQRPFGRRLRRHRRCERHRSCRPEACGSCRHPVITACRP